MTPLSTSERVTVCFVSGHLEFAIIFTMLRLLSRGCQQLLEPPDQCLAAMDSGSFEIRELEAEEVRVTRT